MSGDLANIDVDALRTFISTLQSFNSNLETSWGQLRARWQATSESWRDVKREQFAGQVGWEDEVVRTMETYQASSEKYLTFLKRLEERARAYLEA